MAASTVKVMKFAEGQRQMVSALRQGSFTDFETVLESLTSRDTENKKLVLDQVVIIIIPQTGLFLK